MNQRYLFTHLLALASATYGSLIEGSTQEAEGRVKRIIQLLSDLVTHEEESSVWVTAEEMAEELGCSRPHVYRLGKLGKLETKVVRGVKLFTLPAL